MESHPPNGPTEASSILHNLSDEKAAAVVELHSEQGSHSWQQFVPGGECNHADAQAEPLMKGLHSASASLHKPHIFLWDAGIMICIILGIP